MNNITEIITKKKICCFTFFMFLIALFIRSYDEGMSIANTTMLATSYQEGIYNNALLGTLFRLFCDFFHTTVSYESAMRFSEISLIVECAALGIFIYQINKNASERIKDVLWAGILLLCIFVIPNFSGWDYFGSINNWIITFMFIFSSIVISGRISFAVTLIPVIGILFQSDFLFAYFGICFMLIAYQYAYCNDERKKKKYKHLLLFVTLLLVILFVLLKMSHNWIVIDNSQIENMARILGNGEIDSSALYEMQNGIVFGQGTTPKLGNIMELLEMMVLLLPYIWVVVKVWSNILQKVPQHMKKLYRMIACGGIWILPVMLYNHNYGKWVFALILYYFVTLLVLVAKKDSYMEAALYDMKTNVFSKHSWMVLLLIYPIMLVPFSDINICMITRNGANDLKNVLQILGIL